MSALAPVVVIVGPSGVGKGTVYRRVVAALDNPFVSVSVTTRPPRANEKNGDHYWFVSEDTFERAVAAGEYLEWAKYANHWYATPREPIEIARQHGQIALLEIDVQGALQLKEALPGAVTIFLVPPSFAELERRLRDRGTETDAQIAARLTRATDELASQHEFTHVVVNDDLDTCVADVLAIITGPGSERELYG
jgi:guanylate kinase